MSGPRPLRELPATQQIIQMLFGNSVFQAISVGADLGIADLITNPPKIGEDLAAATS